PQALGQALAEEAHVDGMLDLQDVPAPERWMHLMGTVRQMEAEHGNRWRLKLLVSDSPGAAAELPTLVALLADAGLCYDATREPGGVQGIVISPKVPATDPVAA